MEEAVQGAVAGGENEHHATLPGFQGVDVPRGRDGRIIGSGAVGGCQIKLRLPALLVHTSTLHQ